MVFHVERSLSDAEPPEKRIEHFLDTGSTSNPVEAGSREAESFRCEQRVALTLSVDEVTETFLQYGAVAPVDRHVAFLRQ
jgi:hypothetical protein